MFYIFFRNQAFYRCLTFISVIKSEAVMRNNEGGALGFLGLLPSILEIVPASKQGLPLSTYLVLVSIEHFPNNHCYNYKFTMVKSTL